MKKNIDILIWGELIPNTLTGISISNSNILDVLKKNNSKIEIIEEYSWKLSSIKKILYCFLLLKKHVATLYHFKPMHFYFNIPLSKFGLFKLLIILPVARLFSHKTCFTGHLHRGDILPFYNKSVLNKFLFQLIMTLIDRIIILSDIYSEQLKKIGFKKKIKILHNTSGIEETKFENQKSYTKNFLYLTNYIKSKGIIELIECFTDSELQSFSLDTFGNIYEPKTYDEILAKKTQNITIHGPIAREQLKLILKKFDALILPSWNEGQPIILLEAISIGLPVIASNVGDIQNITGNDYPFIFESHSVESLKKTIFEFNNYTDKNKLGEKLFQHYQTNFSNKIFFRNVTDLFK